MGVSSLAPLLPPPAQSDCSGSLRWQRSGLVAQVGGRVPPLARGHSEPGQSSAAGRIRQAGAAYREMGGALLTAVRAFWKTGGPGANTELHRRSSQAWPEVHRREAGTQGDGPVGWLGQGAVPEGQESPLGFLARPFTSCVTWM